MENSLQNQIKRLQQRKEFLIIFVFLFVIVIFWIGLSIFSSQQRLGITAEQRKLAQPLSPNIDTSVIEKLEQKKWYEDWELQNFPVYGILQSGGVIDTVDITRVPVTSSTPSTDFLQEAPEASPSGEE